MTATIQVEHIQFHAPDHDGIEGTAFYLIFIPCAEDPNPCSGVREGTGQCSIVCTVHPGLHHHYEGQPFRAGSVGHRLTATEDEKRTDRANVWGWDGNREAPTLTPSFLANRTPDSSGGKYNLGYRLHSFLRAGRLDLCSDSTVTLHPAPQQCMFRD